MSENCNEFITSFDDKKAALSMYLWTLNKLTRTMKRKDELEAQKNLSSVEVKLWRDLQSEVVIRRRDYDEENKRTFDAIKKLKDTAHQKVLLQKYVEGLTYSDVALNLGYSERQTIRIHNEAIKNLKIKRCHSD